MGGIRSVEMGRLRALLLGVVVVGCGDDGTSAGDGGASGGTTGDSGASGTMDGGSATTASSATSSGMGTGAGTGTSDAGTSDAGSSDAGTSGPGTGGTGGATDLRFSLDNLMIFQNCMPSVPPDPVRASWDLEVRNLGVIGGDADVVSATFLDGADAPLGTFEVSPTNTGVVDEAETVIVAMTKTMGSLDPANGCSVLACDETAKVELVMDADDTGMVTVVGSATVECAY